MTAPDYPLLEEIRSHLGAAIRQATDADDRIIIGHVIDAYDLTRRAIAKYEADRAVIEALVAALDGMVQEADAYDDRPLEPTCNECTQGSTPLGFDKGPCAYHRASAALAAAGRGK